MRSSQRRSDTVGVDGSYQRVLDIVHHARKKIEFSANSHCDGLISYTERANGSPHVITYREIKGSVSNATMISRSCSPMDLKIVT